MNLLEINMHYNDFTSDCPGRCRQNVPLAPYTTWHIGGPAEFFFEPRDDDDIFSAWDYAKRRGLPFTVLGRGSNILIDDKGISGVTLCTRGALGDLSVDLHRRTVKVGAGHMLSGFASQLCRQGIAGFEFLAGIPGTVGGSIVTNAGTGGPNGPSIKDILVSIDVFDTRDGESYILTPSDLDLRYRCSNVSSRGVVILSAEFRIAGTDAPENLAACLRDIRQARRIKQPQDPFTAGSVFMRPSHDRSAGWYIDQAGLKGQRIGGASISVKHANWIINDGTAKSEDVRLLIAFIQKRVLAEFGIELETEVCFLPKSD